MTPDFFIDPGFRPVGATIHNATAPTLQACQVQLLVDDPLLATRTASIMAAGADQNVTLSWIAANG